MFVNIHTHFEQSDGIFILNGKNQNDLNALYSFGIHPNETLIHDFNVENFENEISQSNCVAIGECGLDKNISVPLETQIAIFKLQIAVSEKLELPIIIHCVKAWNEILAIKKELKPNQPWIYHGFRKSNLVESVLDSGCFVSIGTAIIYDQKLQQAIQNIPLGKLFIETDDDTSHSIQEVYESVARLKNVSINELQEQILKNFALVFRKVRQHSIL
jgi:TatD DNase family protein